MIDDGTTGELSKDERKGIPMSLTSAGLARILEQWAKHEHTENPPWKVDHDQRGPFWVTIQFHARPDVRHVASLLLCCRESFKDDGFYFYWNDDGKSLTIYSTEGEMELVNLRGWVAELRDKLAREG